MIVALGSDDDQIIAVHPGTINHPEPNGMHLQAEPRCLAVSGFCNCMGYLTSVSKVPVSMVVLCFIWMKMR